VKTGACASREREHFDEWNLLSEEPESIKFTVVLVFSCGDPYPFLPQDEDHLDLVRVLITGPTDTPYSRGCFVFDINYPASFPNNPPLVIMITTGGGTVR
jgi:baculoviral IAP repeat-containing protein 6